MSMDKCFHFLAELLSYRWSCGIGHTHAHSSDQLLHKAVLYWLFILPRFALPPLISAPWIIFQNLHVSLCLDNPYNNQDGGTIIIPTSQGRNLRLSKV